jgi:hypothetical protein
LSAWLFFAAGMLAVATGGRLDLGPMLMAGVSLARAVYMFRLRHFHLSRLPAT